MASCPGKRGSSTCSGIVYRCKKCGNVGCDRGRAGECTSQGFKSGRCTKCGAVQKETVK